MAESRMMGRSHRTKTISITSGKGGVGKTTMVTNLAVQMARSGRRVLMLDGDFGMANIDVMFGVRPQGNVLDVINGKVELRDIIVEVHPNVFLIPGGTGLYELSHISSMNKKILMEQINDLEMVFDVMLIDTAPGVDDNVLYLNSAAQETHVVVTPDPSSITDAYALIKVMNQRMREERFFIICNQVKDEAEGKALYRKLCDVASRFLYVSLEYSGSVPLDLNIRKANRARKILSVCNRRALGSFAFQEISEKLCGSKEITEVKGGIQFFWQQMIGLA